MAKRDTSNKSSAEASGGPAASAAGGESAEDRFIALAEQFGRVVGTMQAKAGGWLDRDALKQQLSEVRDGATHLLEQLGAAAGQAREGADSSQQPPTARQETSRTGADRGQQQNRHRSGGGGRRDSAEATVSGRQSSQPTPRGRSGGVVDAPGKKHRKPVENQVRANAADTGRLAKMKVANANRRRGR
jgi:hypothetical protein